MKCLTELVNSLWWKKRNHVYGVDEILIFGVIYDGDGNAWK